MWGNALKGIGAAPRFQSWGTMLLDLAWFRFTLKLKENNMSTGEVHNPNFGSKRPGPKSTPAGYAAPLYT